MIKVGFIGVGTMGCPMATNIISKGNDLNFYDPYVQDDNITKLTDLGAIHCTSLKDLLIDRDYIITMLPNGNNVKEVCLSDNGLLKKVSLFDVYEGDKLPADKKSYALSFLFSDEEQTLTDKVVDKSILKIFTSLEQKLKVELRDGTLK